MIEAFRGKKSGDLVLKSICLFLIVSGLFFHSLSRFPSGRFQIRGLLARLPTLAFHTLCPKLILVSNKIKSLTPKRPTSVAFLPTSLLSSPSSVIHQSVSSGTAAGGTVPEYLHIKSHVFERFYDESPCHEQHFRFVLELGQRRCSG